MIPRSSEQKSTSAAMGNIIGDPQQFTRIFNWILALIATGLIAAIAVTNTHGNMQSVTLIAVNIPLLLLPYYLVRIQAFELASMVTAFLLITLVTILSTFGLGIHHIANLAYPAIIIIASLMTRKRAMIFILSYNIACVAWLVFGELSGVYTPSTLARSLPGDFFSVSLVLIVTAALVRVVTDALIQSHRHLHRELMERKLAEEKYRNIFDNSIDGIFQSTPDGRLISVNPAMAEMYGYDSPKDMVEHISDIASQIYINPEMRNIIRRRLENGEQIKGYESLEYRKNGTTLWTSMNAQVIRDENGNVLYYEGTVEDITERKKFEEERNIFHSLSIDMVGTAGTDGYFKQINPAFEKTLGYSPSEFLSKPFFNFVHPNDLEATRAEVDKLSHGAPTTSFINRYKCKDGTYKWLEWNVTPVEESLYAIARDITESKKTQDALLQFRNLMDESNDSIFVIDLQTGRYIDFNKKACEQLGYSRNELLEFSVFDVAQHIQTLPVWHERVAIVREKGGLIFETNYKRRDGSIFPVEVSARLRDYGNQAVVVALVRDITERKKADEVLRENQRRLQAFFNQSLDGFFFTIFNTPRVWDDTVNKDEVLENIFTTEYFTEVNDALLEQYGMEREQFLSLTSRDVFAHDPQQGLQLRRQLFDNGHLHTETFERRADGTPVWFEGDYACLYDEQKQIVGFFCMQRDITKRKQNEIALKASEMKFRLLAENIPSVVFQCKNDSKYTFIYLNDKVEELTGYPARAFLEDGMSFFDIYHPDDVPRITASQNVLIQEATAYHVTYRIRHRSGDWRWVDEWGAYIADENGHTDYFVGLINDVTELKQAEDEREALITQLAARNEESETLRESFASVINTIDFSEIIQRVLNQIKRVIPYDSTSVWTIEGNYQKFIAGRDLPSGVVSEIHIDQANSAAPLLEGDVAYVLSNNVQEELPDFKEPPDNLINSWLAIPLKTRGKVIGFIALDGYQKDQFNERHIELALDFANQVAIALENSRLFTDLQLELALRKNLIAELESKNTELERFTYTVSHDLKSPLVTINGFLGYLEADIAAGNTDRVKRDRERIQDAVNKMHHLLNDLLELSRIGRLMNKPERIEFNDLVNDTLQIVHGRLEENRVTVHSQPNLPAVYGDRQRLTEVLQNLLDNAAKFMGNQAVPQIEIGQAGEENGKLIFFVKDNGIGIAPQYHEQVFGLFNKLDAQGSGTGIGLALVKRIIEVHGGRIWVESEAEKGATFYFSLSTPPKSEASGN